MGKRYLKRVKADKFRLYLGNSRKVLKDLPADFVHSVVCDPPYGLSFMGKKWDYDVPSPKLWAEVYRVMKPGAYLIAFFGTRTYHRGVIAIEDAGFEIRDQIAWLYGSGFPKGLNISKSIDKKLGTKEKRKVVGEHKAPAGNKGKNRSLPLKGMGKKGEVMLTEGGSEEAQDWEGWNTALKPAMEPIVIAMKPLEKGLSITDNVMKHGVGCLNINECRVPVKEGDYEHSGKSAPYGEHFIQGRTYGKRKVETGPREPHALGRYPANVIHDGSDEVTRLFTEGASPKSYVRSADGKNASVYGKGVGENAGSLSLNFGDSGNNARFFYCAKASKSDRDEGMALSASKSMGGKGNGMQRVCSVCNSNIMKGCECPGRTYIHTESRKNHHPTVKPTDLMAYLCRLVTPKDGIVLDPFMGSGSTGKAAMKEDFRFIGVEMDPDYFEVAHTRVAHAAKKYEIRRKSLFKASK